MSSNGAVAVEADAALEPSTSSIGPQPSTSTSGPPSSRSLPPIQTDQLHKKRHPADLVSPSNPDPHQSPAQSSLGQFKPGDSPFATPTSELEQPHFSSHHARQDSNPSSERSDAGEAHGHFGGASSVDAHGVLASEAGGTAGHGSNESRDLVGSIDHTNPSRRGSEAQRWSVDEDRDALGNLGSSPPTAHEIEQINGVDAKLEQLAIDPKQERATSVLPEQGAIGGSSGSPSASRAPPPAPSSVSHSPTSSRLKGHGRSQSMASPPSSRSMEPPVETRSKEPSTSSRRDRERESQANGKSSATKEGAQPTKESSSSSRSRRVLGEWQMTKTLGAGSMGKVKLAISSVTGEKVAIKIIPRFTSTAAAHRPPPPPESKDGKPPPTAPPPPPTASFLAKAAAKDASKEVRTMREGSLCMLLHHPYVCGMKSMVLYPHHYYMVTEYVNGGQMLDYIISHGRLRERSARKFARQIGSALEYCHANSIVHRDLKIENILISKTGNIKIIDFGLSNLYSPVSHLSTFCGSLYFAAPELLNAKPYTGPEVDVWSFGIVLYVLVCGKVPFDDQSMPALHAKIKRGQVEYPTWLSAECKHLLSRMLVTTPSLRASLSEVLSHPWIVKGFTGPPAIHLPPRVPLRAEELSREIIEGMTGFEFGSPIDIHAKLLDVLESDLYRTALRAWDAKRAGLGVGGDSEERLSDRPATRTDGKDMKRSPTNKRFSGFGFYSKKLAGGLNAAFAAGGTSSTAKTSSEFGNSNGNRSSGSLAGPNGPKLDPLDPTKGFHPLISIYYLVKEKMEREKIWGPGVFASSTLSLTGPPPPPAPAQAYQSGTGVISPALPPAIAKPGQAAAADPSPAQASPRLPMTPQPRPRATGEEFPTTAPSTAPQNRSSFASRRTSYHAGAVSLGVASGARPASHYDSSTPAAGSYRASSAYEPPKSPTPQSRRGSQAAEDGEDGASASSSPGGGFARRFGSLLGRRDPPVMDPGYKGHRQRASMSGTAHKAGTKTALSALPQVAEPTGVPRSESDVPIQAPPQGKPVARSSTVGELSPSRHQRGVSLSSASPLNYSHTVGRASRVASTGQPHAVDEGMEELAGVDDEHVSREQEDVGFVGRTPSQQASETSGAKPVWLKGLFSVATTSTKPTAIIRADLVRVLDRLGVQHRDVKGGFECAHVPSIDLSSVGSEKAKKEAGLAAARGTIKRRASKLLLSTTTSKDGSPTTPSAFAGEESQTSLSVPQTPSAPNARAASSTSFIEPNSPNIDRRPSAADPSSAVGASGPSGAVKSEMIVRFEIFIVKMPWLPGIHGLQFRRITGNAWQYQMLAKRVLQEIKL